MAAEIGSLYASLTMDVGPYAASWALADRITARGASTIRKEAGAAQSSIERLSKSTSNGIRPYGLIAVSRAFERVNDRVGLLRGTLLATTAVFGGLTAALSSNLILRYADTYNNLSNQIRVVSRDSSDLAGQIAAVSQAANDSRSSLQATATLYARLQKAAPNASSNEVLDYVQTIQKALALGGATAQEATSAAIQFSQAIASNRLGGEELRAVLETPLGLALAKGLDVTIGKLREMSIAGELTADKVLGALARVKGDIDQQFSKSTRTIDQSLVQADNRLTEYVGQLDKTYGITRLVSGAILGFADNIDTVANSVATLGLALGSAFAGRLVGRGAGKAADATYGAIVRGSKAAKEEVESLKKTQADLVDQLDKSSRAFQNLEKRSDIEFASKSDLKLIQREEAKLNAIREDRLKVSKKLADATENAAAVEVQSSKSTVSAAARIIATDQKIEASKARQIALTNELAQAEARLTAAQGKQALNTATIGAVKEAEKDILTIRKAQQVELDKTSKLEQSLGEQRITLATKVGEEEAKAAEKRARFQAIAKATAKQDLQLRVDEFAQTQRLARARAAVTEVGSLGKGRAIADATNALGTLQNNLKQTQSGLAEATRNTGLLAQSFKVLKAGGSGLLSFLGGPWGVAFGLAIGALTLFGAHAAKAAQQVERAQKSMGERLEEVAQSGRDIAKSAEDAVESARLKGELKNVEQEIEDYKAVLGQNSREITGTLQEILGDAIRNRQIKQSDFDSALEGTANAIEDISTRAAKTPGLINHIGEAVRAIPEIEFADDDTINHVVDIVKHTTDLKIAAAAAGVEFADISREVNSTIGNLQALQKVQNLADLPFQQTTDALLKTKVSSKAFDQLINQSKALSKESEYEKNIREQTAGILKNNSTITRAQAHDAAIVSTVLDTINSSSDEWLKSTEATSGEFGKLLALAKQIAPNIDFSKRSLNTTELAAVGDLINKQTDLAKKQADRLGLSERERDILNKQDEILGSIRDKFGTIAGVNLDNVREAATTMVDLEHASEGLATAKEVLDGLGGSVDGSAKAVTGLSSILASSGEQAALFARTQVAALTQVVEKRQQIDSLTASLSYYQGQLTSISTTVPEDVFGALGKTERVASQIAFLTGEIGALGEKFLKNKITGDQLVKSISDIESKLLALGANKDPLRNFINSILTALGNVRALSASLDVLSQKQQKVGTSGVRTQYDVPGGSVGVTRFGSNSNEQAPSGPVLKQINVQDFLSGFDVGGFTGNAPTDAIAGFVHGKEFVFDAKSARRIGIGNLEAMRKGALGGYQSGGPVGASAGTVVGGANYLKMIEENTYQINDGIVRQISYLDTLVKDGQTATSLLQAIKSAIGASSINIKGADTTETSSATSIAANSTASSDTNLPSALETSTPSPEPRYGGFSSSGSGASYSAFGSPYFYRPNVAREALGGGGYDPLSDLLLNGNKGALGSVANSLARGGMYTAPSIGALGERIPFDVNSAIKSLLASAPSGVQRGSGALDISADSDFVGGGGFFGGRTATSLDTQALSEALLESRGDYAKSFLNGFATGGMIHPGDSQQVSFFKNPNETVGIFTPQQMDAMQDGYGGGNEYHGHSHYHAAPGNPEPSQRSQMEMQDRTRQAVLGIMQGR